MEWVNEFQTWLEDRGQAANTIKGYISDVKIYATWIRAEYDADFNLSEITSRDLRNYRKYILHEQKAAANSWNRYRVALKSLCDFAVDQGILEPVNFDNVKMADAEVLAPHWMTKKDYGKFMRIVDRELPPGASEFAKFVNLRDRAMVYLMMYAGLRVSEVSGLRFTNLKMTADSSKAHVVFFGKGEKYALIPLNTDTRRVLNAYLDYCWEIGVLEKERTTGKDSIFVSKGNKRCSVKTIQRVVANFAYAARLEDVTPHTLRHTCAKRMVDAGVPLTIVQKILRHSRLDTTAVYIQPSIEDLENALDKL
jgi:integrase/recombinase XerC